MKRCDLCAFCEDYGYNVIKCQLSKKFIIHPLKQAMFCQMFRPEKEKEKE